MRYTRLYFHIGRFRELRKRWGLPAAVFAAFVSVLRSRLHIRIYGIYGRAHASSGPQTSTDPAISYRIFSKSDLDELLEQARRPELDMSVAFIREALGKGDICSAALIEGNIVSYVWSAFTATHDTDNVYVVFPSGFRYGYKAYTLPEYRGRHLREATIPLQDKYCVERGCMHSLAFIAVDNYASTRYTTRIGFTRVGFVAFYKTGSRCIAYHSPGVKKLGLRFESRDGTQAP